MFLRENQSDLTTRQFRRGCCASIIVSNAPCTAGIGAKLADGLGKDE